EPGPITLLAPPKAYLQNANRNFFSNLSNYNVQWVAVKELVEDFNQSTSDKDHGSDQMSKKKMRATPRMSPRYHHHACCVGRDMYVFGGSISLTTAYNDLWRFDTTRKRWH